MASATGNVDYMISCILVWFMLSQFTCCLRQKLNIVAYITIEINIFNVTFDTLALVPPIQIEVTGIFQYNIHTKHVKACTENTQSPMGTF